VERAVGKGVKSTDKKTSQYRK